MNKVVVYSIVGCPHCSTAKSSLKNLNIEYVDVSVDKYPPKVRIWLKEKVGKTSVPQIFFGNHHVGGNKELQESINEPEKWKKLLEYLQSSSQESEIWIPEKDEELDEIDGNSKLICEPDELAPFLIDLQLPESGVIKYNKTGIFCGIKDSFTGKDFIDWLKDKKGLPRSKGIQIGSAMLKEKFAVEVENSENLTFKDEEKVIYKLQGVFRLDDKNIPLNVGSELNLCVKRPGEDVAKDVRKAVLKLFSDHIDPTKHRVDYSGIKNSEEFALFVQLTKELIRTDLNSMKRNNLLAFFINIYNACVIHGNIQKGVPENMWQRYKFFSSTGYTIGGHFYSLNDIENGILRGNRSSMASLYKIPFKPSDPRFTLTLTPCDPRIHFALNCGAKSCPPIKTFSGDQVEEELSTATESFLESDEGIFINEDKTIFLSMLFNWYSIDFGESKIDILNWILKNIGDYNPKKQILASILDSGDKIKVKYITYDWGHNGND